ncbi:glycosyltransferase family 39 protein, partial [Patescibacteria group bacterium]|nr:glycosyltransferase family 39 protein [Patescibacteria group bacterium]
IFSSDFKEEGLSTDRFFYPVFLALVYKIFGHNYHAVTAVQIFLFVLIVLLVYKTCQMLFKEKVARLAGVFTALCYSIASFSGWLYREVLFVFLVALLIYCLYKAQATFRNAWFAWAGVVATLSFLTNAIIQFFIIAAIINFFIVFHKKKFKEKLLKIGLFILSFILSISPFLLNGYISFGGGGVEGLILRERAEKMQRLEGNYWEHFIGNTLSDFFAYKWFKGYNPTEVRHGIETWDRRGEWVDQGKDWNELNEIFLKEAKDFIPKHPIMYLKQSSIDFLKFNTPMIPNMRMQHVFVSTHPELSDFTKGLIIVLIRLVYLIFFALIIYAIIKHIKSWSKLSWILLLVLSFNLVFASICAIARYSVPIYPSYIILFSLGLVSFWDKMKEKI